MEAITDRELVDRARRGQTDAFDALTRRHFPAVYAVALARLRQPEAAEDLAQEVFLRIFLNLSALRDGDRLGAWAIRLARNLAIDWLRKGKVRSSLVPLVPLDGEATEVADTGQQNARERIMEDENRREVEEATWQLPENLRELVLMHYMEGMTKKEIADRLGMHPATVGRQLETALGKMRETMESRVQQSLSPRRVSPRTMRRAAALAVAVATMAPEAKAAITTAAAREGASAALAAATATGAATPAGAGTAAGGFSVASFLQSVGGLVAAGGSTMGAGKLAICGGVAALGIAGGAVYALHESDEAIVQNMIVEMSQPGQPLHGLDVANMPTFVMGQGTTGELVIPFGTGVRLVSDKPDDSAKASFAVVDDKGVTIALNLAPEFLQIQKLLDTTSTFSTEGWTGEGHLTEFVHIRREEDKVVIFREVLDQPQLEKSIAKLREGFNNGTIPAREVAAKAEAEARRLKAGPKNEKYREEYYKTLRKSLLDNRYQRIPAANLPK